MEEFIDNIRILINALGYRVLVPMPQATSTTVILRCTGNGGNASGFVSNGGFTVQKGSTVSDHTVPSFEVHGAGYFDLRQKLESNGIIAERIFMNDYEFRSPSAASSVVLGHTSNGNTDWKTADGKKLKDVI